MSLAKGLLYCPCPGSPKDHHSPLAERGQSGGENRVPSPCMRHETRWLAPFFILTMGSWGPRRRESTLSLGLFPQGLRSPSQGSCSGWASEPFNSWDLCFANAPFLYSRHIDPWPRGFWVSPFGGWGLSTLSTHQEGHSKPFSRMDRWAHVAS